MNSDIEQDGNGEFVFDPAFFRKFHAEDQRLLRSGEWDYKQTNTAFNKSKDALERLDDTNLTEEERSDKDNALWLWYHHGAQVAYFKHRDQKIALAFIEKAMHYSEVIQLDNQITPLLKLLFSGDIAGARSFADAIPERTMERQLDGTEKEVENVEKATADQLVRYFEGTQR